MQTKSADQEPRLRSFLASIALLSAAVVVSTWNIWLAYPANAGGDAHTYAGYARQLARGQTCFSGVVSRSLSDRRVVGRAVSGPVWNTAILPDGRWVYTVAPGFPLFLAAMLRVGGSGLMLHANFPLLIAVTVAFWVLLLTSFTSRAGRWWPAMLGALLLLSLDTSTQTQFASLWREPLLFLLMLCAATVFALRARVRGLYWILPPTLGFACAVKESYILYAAWAGVCLLLSPEFRRAPGFWKRVIGGGMLFLVGCSPLLWQNWSHSGTPWTSLYVLRETGEFSLDAPGMGLSAGNTFNTLARYARLYRPHVLWLAPLLAVSAWDAWQRRNLPVMRLLLGWFVLHVALHLQWGNAELRHMYFAIFPVLFAFVHGASDLLDRLAPIAPRMRDAALIAASAALTLWMPLRRERVVDFRYADWNRLVRAVSDHVPEGTVVLSNRRLSDVLVAYTDWATVRTHELDSFSGGKSMAMLRDILESGGDAVFIDCADTSPDGIRSGVDRSRQDRKQLLDSFDLAPVSTFTDSRREFVETVGKPGFTLFRVTPWTAGMQTRVIPLPAEGAAFAVVDASTRGPSRTFAVNGEAVSADAVRSGFFPLSADATGQVTIASFSSPPAAALAPSLAQATTVDWFEPIPLTCGADAIPDDRAWFPAPDNDHAIGHRGRVVSHRATIVVPVREGMELMTTVGLRLSGSPTGMPCSVTFDTGERFEQRIERDTYWLTVPNRAKLRRQAGFRAMRLEIPPSAGVTVSRLVSRVARREALLPPADGLAGHLVAGTIVRDDGEGRWSCRLEGTPVASGLASADPFSNPFLLFVPAAGARALRWDGGGLMDMDILPVPRVLRLRPGDRALKHVATGLHPCESGPAGDFQWTKGTAVWRVPAPAEGPSYRLRLWLAGDRREPAVRVHIGGHQTEWTLTLDVGVYTWTPPPLSGQHGLIDIRLESTSWRPSDRGADDGRLLGVRWYGLEWGPPDAADSEEDG